MMYNLHTRVHSSDTHTHTKMSAYFCLIRTFIFPIWHLLSFKSINIYSPPVICSSFKIRFTNEYAWKYAVDYLCQCIVVAAAASAGVVVLVFFVKKVSSTSNTMCQIDAIWIMRRNAIMVIQPSFLRVCVYECAIYLSGNFFAMSVRFQCHVQYLNKLRINKKLLLIISINFPRNGCETFLWWSLRLQKSTLCQFVREKNLSREKR